MTAAAMPAPRWAELRQQPAAEEGTDDSDDEIADDPEPRALHDLTRKPPGKEADEHNDEKALARHVHFVPIRICRIAGQILASGYESPAN